MNKRLEELRLKKEELMNRNKEQVAPERNRTPLPSRINNLNEEQRQARSEVPQRNGNLLITNEVSMLVSKKIAKNVMLDESVSVRFEDLVKRPKLVANDEDSGSDTKSATGSDKFGAVVNLIREKSRTRIATYEPIENTFRVLENDEYDAYVSRNGSALKSFLEQVTSKIEDELGAVGAANQLIEDYIFNQNKDIQETKGGCTVRRIEDLELEGKYMITDIMWMSDFLMNTEKIVLAASKYSATARDANMDSQDYILNVYSMEKRLINRTCRSEIKKIEIDREQLEDNISIVYGGLENGRIAVWDLRTQRPLPDTLSKLTDTSNYLSIMDIKKIKTNLFTVGQEGRVCKWDVRKLDEPIFHLDLFCVADNNNIAQLESMPFGFEFDPSDPDKLFVNTFEGSVYELLMTPNAFQQRSIFQNVHDAPIVSLKAMNYKKFFGDLINRSKTDSMIQGTKYSNFYVTASFDWKVKIFKGIFGNEIQTIKYHDDFVTALDVNNNLSPFCFASADAEGKLAVWNYNAGNWSAPVFEWNNDCAITRLQWNKTGTKLAVSDVKGKLNVITIPKSKIMLSEKVLTSLAENGMKDIKRVN